MSDIVSVFWKQPQEIFVVANNSMELPFKILGTWKRTYPWKQADINLRLQRSSETTSIYRSIMLTNSNGSDFNILIRKTEGYQFYHNDVCWRWKLRMHHFRSLAILHYFISDPSPNKSLFYSWVGGKMLDTNSQWDRNVCFYCLQMNLFQTLSGIRTIR